ncbi:hypothetical protein CLV98_12318 [Dyadobacter jejuensis]|uniref:DUF6705 domain-containing protein n=1 Tax=Dyadobacter jejuensis TaxID=1082580 RepID=A0A316A973_9BACT|nr:DUF6705 family protein [Dyadobacter jejuensis]PWJ53404.1 hypothetical protein CLV98_12318 [Dyadobacter jejuensis]
MKYLSIILLFAFVSCKNDVAPNNVEALSTDQKVIRNATLDTFVGQWVYFLNGEPYKKIVISKGNDSLDYVFQHYYVSAGQYKIDQEIYPEQVLDNSMFTTWDKSVWFLPYITILSSYSSGTQTMVFKSNNGNELLELGINKYTKTI